MIHNRQPRCDFKRPNLVLSEDRTFRAFLGFWQTGEMRNTEGNVKFA